MIKLKRFNPVPLGKVGIDDSFWSPRTELVRKVVIPYQWEALNDRIPDGEPSYAIHNFQIAAGETQGEFGGKVFQDSDLAKWLEAVAYCLTTQRDTVMESRADEAIDLISRAQQEDGYLNTYFTIKDPQHRWAYLQDAHELYCAGHLIEAAVAYYQATGKKKFLEVMGRYVALIDSVFGPEPGKVRGYSGHQEIELALVKLYRVTGNDQYLRLSQYFIDERGREPYYFDLEWERNGHTNYRGEKSPVQRKREYHQTHKPVREQTAAVGHAVRAMYMYTAMADLAAENGDTGLWYACRRLWRNVVTKQMYITGGIGSTESGEAFSFDYDLPNDTVYAETCASIGLIFFAHRMLQIEANSTYADVIERALYNTVLSSMAQDGRHFFYVNPLEVWPEACAKQPLKAHVKPVRQKWFGCACCPPNVARLLASLGQYIYTVDSETVYTHLYIGSRAEIELAGNRFTITQETSYPWRGWIKLCLSGLPPQQFTLGLRIPGWCQQAKISINGTKTGTGKSKDGYVRLTQVWHSGDVIELELAMPVEVVHANPLVRADAGKVALQRGPLVYCLEEVDNGGNLAAISLPAASEWHAEIAPALFGGIVTLKGTALRDETAGWGETLYQARAVPSRPTMLLAVPYFLWGNRQPGEMIVWLRQNR
jgi:DUF1680 family protein